MRLMQFEAPNGSRALAATEDGQTRLVEGAFTTLELAQLALSDGVGLAQAARERRSKTHVDRAALLAEQRVLPPVDHPEPERFLVSGTGLTHLASAETRDQMHREPSRQAETDSQALFRLGVEGGKPADGGVGVQPEWFFKGTGHALVRPGGELRVPDFALDAGEEPEIVGLYWIGPGGEPLRLGFALGNELSDHVTEAKNYLYLAHSKLLPFSIGPELLLGELPASVVGESRIVRGPAVIWQKPFRSGEANMSHHISGLEHHHFKYPAFRIPGQLHAHFFGTSTLSFADGVRAQPGDRFEVSCPAFGEPLVNRLTRVPATRVAVRAL